MWMSSNSHSVFESHLPSSVPLSLIDKVVIPSCLYAALSPAEKKNLRSALPDEGGRSRVIVGTSRTGDKHDTYFYESIKHARLRHAHRLDGIQIAMSAKAGYEVAMPLLIKFPDKVADRLAHCAADTKRAHAAHDSPVLTLCFC